MDRAKATISGTCLCNQDQPWSCD